MPSIYRERFQRLQMMPTNMGLLFGTRQGATCSLKLAEGDSATSIGSQYFIKTWRRSDSMPLLDSGSPTGERLRPCIHSPEIVCQKHKPEDHGMQCLVMENSTCVRSPNVHGNIVGDT